MFRTVPQPALMRTARLSALAACVAALLSSCAFGTRLDTKTALPADATGSYRLYLYGCRNPDDLENLALLVDEAAPYRFELYVLDTSYRMTSGLLGAVALREADAFIRCSHHSIWMTAFRRIVDPEGRTVAYELKPLYFPHQTGKDEVLLTDYLLKDGVITVYIRLDPSIERMQNHFTFSPSGL